MTRAGNPGQGVCSDAGMLIDRSGPSLGEAFRHDLDAIAKALIDAFGLRFAKEMPNLTEPLLRWLDFRFRYVEPKPRLLAFSDRFSKPLEPEAYRALLPFLKKVESGEDINPYQGRGLKFRHDTSGRNRSNRTDYLFASLNLLHFHLSEEPIPTGQYFSKPANWLAFGIITDKQMALVDVVRHPGKDGFSDPAFFETLVRSWPDSMEPFRIKGPSLAGRSLTQAEIHALREGGVNAPYVFNGQIYMGPGGGYTSAGTMAKTRMAMAHITRTFDSLAETVWALAGPYRSHEAVVQVTDPRFSLRLYAGGLGVYEERTRTLFVEPPRPHAVPQSLRWLSDLVTPPWTLLEVMKQKDIFNELFCGLLPDHP